MPKSALTSLTIAATLTAASAAGAGPAIVTGPLGDSQLVRGKELGMSYLHYGPSGADPQSQAVIHYSFYGETPIATATMSPTGYGNRVSFLQVPADADGFWYTIHVADGSIQSDGGEPHAIPVQDRAVRLTRAYAGSDYEVRYSGPVTTTYDTYMHLGWNDWNAVGDAFMQRSDFVYTRAGVSYDYNYVNITPPWWADYNDFVFKDARNGGTWDNNDGQDWHESVKPLVSSSIGYNGGGTVSVLIHYSGGWLNPVRIHYGIDGWQGVTDVAMQPATNGWQAYLSVPEGTAEVNFVFHDGNGSWQNNYGMSWIVEIPQVP